MKKTMTVFLSFLLFDFITCSSIYAEDASKDTLLARIEKLEQRQSLLSRSWMHRIAVSGILEAEAGFVRTDHSDPAAANTDESDAVLATMGLGICADITDYVSGHMVFLWEEDDTDPINLDTGFIIVSGGDKLPVYVNAGKMYLPFGVFHSSMISDPLTLELAETRESAVQIGFEANGFYGSTYIFNGEIDEDGKDSHLDNFGAHVGVVVEADKFFLDVSAGYTNNILDSDGLGDYLTETMEAEGVVLNKYVEGISASACFFLGPVILVGEYITALDKTEFISETDETAATGKKMSAFNAEMACAFPCFGKETTLGIAYQGSTHTGNFLPETRMMGAARACIFDGTTLALEYSRDKFENDDKVDRVTAQLAIEF